MTGKAYNPKGWEPDAHERYFAPPKEVMERYRELFSASDPHHNKTTYKEIQEWRKRGESHALGHYAVDAQYHMAYRGSKHLPRICSSGGGRAYRRQH